MKKIKQWWKKVWYEEYELITTVPRDATIHHDGTRTETTKEKKYKAKKLIKTSPKHFIFIDMKDNKNEIKFQQPVIDFHIVKIW